MSKQQPMDGKSKDLKAEKLEALNKQFPELFSEGKLDVEKLKQSLDEKMVTGDERYRLEWAGKHKVFEEIAKRTTSTLTPDIERSVDFENSQNVFIEGENLEVLRVLQKAYFNKVKMIYIDPPYNTGNDFVYNDNFRETMAEYDEAAGNLDENGNIARAFTLNSKDSGQYHSNWLNMMYPRLFLARNLLREDGVIFVSIDDNEVHNLRMLMNEIFGEENFINMFTWKKNSSGKTVSKEFPTNIEYVLMFAKQLDEMQFNVVYKPLADATIKMYSKDDNDGRGKYRLYPMQKTSSPGPETTYDYVDNNGKIWKCPEKGWRMIQGKMKALENDGRLCLENKTISEKAYWNERTNEGQVADTLWDDIDEGNIGTAELRKLFNSVVFDYPKPTDLLSRIIKIGSSDSNIVLDFFSGSGTISHSVMQQNAEDGGNRKYVCVQIPEATPPDSEARKAGYKTIADIAVERIKRAAKKIKDENPEYTGDLGVKVYKQTLSHFPAWRAESFESDEALQLNLGSFAEKKAVGEAGARAIELLLKLGYDLNTELEEKAGYYSAAKGEVLLVVDEKAKVDLEKLLTEKPSVVVVLEDVFKGDDAKINFALACKERNVTFQTV